MISQQHSQTIVRAIQKLIVVPQVTINIWSLSHIYFDPRISDRDFNNFRLCTLGYADRRVKRNVQFYMMELINREQWRISLWVSSSTPEI